MTPRVRAARDAGRPQERLRARGNPEYVGRVDAGSFGLIAAALLAVAWIALVRRDRQMLGAGAYYASATLALLGLTA